MYAHLLEIQRKLGKEEFPLIEQTFFPDYQQMVRARHLVTLRRDMCR